MSELLSVEDEYQRSLTVREGVGGPLKVRRQGHYQNSTITQSALTIELQKKTNTVISYSFYFVL